jgi:stage II sporulation protein D
MLRKLLSSFTIYPMISRWRFLTTFCLCALLQLAIGSPLMAAILRVLVREEIGKPIPVAVTQPATVAIVGANGQPQPTQSLSPGQWYTIPPQSVTRIIPSNGGFTQVGDRLYPGEIEIRSWQNRTLAINILPLEEYLRSVVPNEMPASWHLDALKAQAVAARSYALNTQKQRKWGSAPYDLVSDVRDQVYAGFYKFEPNSTTPKPLIHPRSDQAVVGTNGFVLRQGFKGYYRARLQRNWISWNGGYMPVSDGQHMDQEMTQEMALRGWNWVQILSWWYRDQPIKP